MDKSVISGWGEDIPRLKQSFSNHVHSKTHTESETFTKGFKALRIPKPSANVPQCQPHHPSVS